jgi:hypothetical protein
MIEVEVEVVMEAVEETELQRALVFALGRWSLSSGTKR